MVLFPPKGELNIRLDRNTFAPGETISGEVTYNMARPTKGDSLCVYLRVHQEETRGIIPGLILDDDDDDGEDPSCAGTTLCGSGDYTRAKMPFQLAVPPHVRPSEGQSGFGNLSFKDRFVGGSTRTSYYVEARLNVPMAYDLTSRVPVTIARPGGAGPAGPPPGPAPAPPGPPRGGYPQPRR